MIDSTQLEIRDADAPSIDNSTVARRTREYLTADEMAQVIEAAKGNRYGHRDATMILLAYRHGLRVSELIGLRWSAVMFESARLHVTRLKGSHSGVHPLQGDELRALRKLRAASPHADSVFTSERGAPFTADGFRKLIARAAATAGLGALRIHPHMLRHACGYALANKGTDTRTIQDYLGHASITNTVRYTALDASRFNGLWEG